MPSPRRRRPEGAFNDRVRRLARSLGYLTYHTRRSKGSEPGFPDIVFCHPVTGDLFFAELKADVRCKPTEAQQEWLHAIARSPVEAYLWTPDDSEAIGLRLAKGAGYEVRYPERGSGDNNSERRTV